MVAHVESVLKAFCEKMLAKIFSPALAYRFEMAKIDAFRLAGPLALVVAFVAVFYYLASSFLPELGIRKVGGWTFARVWAETFSTMMSVVFVSMFFLNKPSSEDEKASAAKKNKSTKRKSKSS